MSKKIIVNVGCARSGTTAMEAYYEKSSCIETPFGKKEIQAFSGKEINFKQYLTYFSDKDADVYFESSPPYVHAGIDKFKKVVSNLKRLKEDADIEVVFNLRSLVKRAFSHYWHDISKHHALFGADWSVRSKNSSDRFKSLYTDNFFEALAKDYNKFLPDIMGMICVAGNQLGWANISVILQKELNDGVQRLSEKIGIRSGLQNVPRTIGCKAPVFLSGGKYKVSGHNDEKIIDLESGSIAIIGYDGIEVISDNQFDVNQLIFASRQWSTDVTYSTMSSIFDRYFSEQKRQLKNIPQNVFLTNLDVETELFKVENASIDMQAVVEKVYD